MENRVILTLTVLLLAAVWLLPLVNFAPNRLVSGRGIGLAELLSGARLLLLLPALGLLAPTRSRYVVVLLLAEGLLCGLLWLAGEGARELAAQGGRLVRTSFGSGFWLMAALCLLTASEAVGRLTANSCLRALANGQLWLTLALLLARGRLDELSLMKEYANRAQVFHQAFAEHLTLLFGTLGPALLIGIPLGLLCHRSARWRPSLFAALNIIQTLPAIALFGLLIALVLYALLPLALPVMLSGVRVIAVQTVGMGMVAALIGAGWFGALMFQGLLSSALELVLLGVIPAVAQALVVDTLFKVMISMLQKVRL
ncbi:ABC transporter permease [Candidatus Sodalis endolongispinus]|uniref:ABC transporter permease n=1 Tax=Candidatus Sodalis endolongispinus TaxID=2812662 RepID=A0ABS5YE97_9GAMM|nr:ABC transporter permease [Candidatus Sodalis endolongispinus]MBT9433375.1 ABC transporter permease [Candidatus Sodalis endolongispinus]